MLKKKLLRDLRRNLSQFFVIFMMVLLSVPLTAFGTSQNVDKFDKRVEVVFFLVKQLFL